MSNDRYGQFLVEHLQKIQYGIELFNEQKYWECHEELEDLWLETDVCVMSSGRDNPLAY